jgi:hypothetical protein
MWAGDGIESHQAVLFRSSNAGGAFSDRDIPADPAILTLLR